MVIQWIALCFACVSAIVSAWAWLTSRRTYRNSALSRKLAQLELDNATLETSINGLRDMLKKQSARLAARDRRANDNENGSAGTTPASDWAQKPGETPEEWKRRMRLGPLLRGERPKGP